MAENGYGPAVPGHVGRIPNYGRTQVNPMGTTEPPACIQNAMMTKDKKPFTYTPGGLDLSQIKTPSMARRMARQRSLEEQEQAYAQANGGNYHNQGNGGNYHNQGNGGNYHNQGGPVPPPPPPPQAPAPPPPPPLVISVPKSKSPKPVPLGERPEIVIPENPIGMLRKTNSPFHWESEKAELDRIGNVPKFVEKVPSPLTVKMPPSNFSQEPPTHQRPNPIYSNQSPGSPIHRPEAHYGQKFTPPISSSPQTKELLQRQDSQFNKSPEPYNQSPVSNGSPFSPVPNNSWKQPQKRDSSAQNVQTPPDFSRSSTFSPNPQSMQNVQNQTSPVSPVYHTLPRASPRTQEPSNQNTYINNNVSVAGPQSPRVEVAATTPWRTNNVKPREPENTPQIYHNSQPLNQQPTYTPPWKMDLNNNSNNNEQNYNPPWKQNNTIQNQVNGQQQQHQQPQQTQPDRQLHLQQTSPWVSNEPKNNIQETTPWRTNQKNNNYTVPPAPPVRNNQMPVEQPRYQSTISIPVTPRKPKEPEPNTEIVYVNQEPVYYCPESPNSIPPWVKTKKEKTKTPPPAWCQRSFDGNSYPQRDLVTPPPTENNQEPEWVRKSYEMQRGARDIVSPPKQHQPVQPTWSTKPSNNLKSAPKEVPQANGSRIIPISVESSSSPGKNQHNLRVTVNSQTEQPPQGPYSQPTQRIMRVLSPQLVRMEPGFPQDDLPSLNRTFVNQQENHKTRIIPIQIEGGSNGGHNQRVYYHKFVQDGPPRQSKAFRVLQIITGTEDIDNVQNVEKTHGFTDL